MAITIPQEPTFKPNVDYQPHKALESDVKEFLHANGFFTDEVTYHSRLPRNMVDLLSKRWSPTALYLRGRADRIAIHKTMPVEFEWECKTHGAVKYNDMAIEALPLAHHITKARLDVKCLYIYRNPFEQKEYGFWVNDIPGIRCCNIPSRWDGEMKNFFTRVFMSSYPGVTLNYPIHSNGSGDPYLLINHDEIIKLSNWKDLIMELIAHAEIPTTSH